MKILKYITLSNSKNNVKDYYYFTNDFSFGTVYALHEKLLFLHKRYVQGFKYFNQSTQNNYYLSNYNNDK